MAHQLPRSPFGPHAEGGGSAEARVPPRASANGVLAPGDKRAAIVADALYTIERHSCSTCEAGSWCDTIVHAHHVVSLNELFEEHESMMPAAAVIQEAHQNGKLEGTAQALAVIGRAEGEFRSKADGNAEHPAFTLAETHRVLATTIRKELQEPGRRTALESKARSEEATELSAYVRQMSQQFRRGSQDGVAKVLDNVAGDLAKGSEGVTKLRQAADDASSPALLRALMADIDPDVRWWAAQNPTTPVDALEAAAECERHPTVLLALIANRHLPIEQVLPFAGHGHVEVAAAAQRRLAL